MVPDARRRPSPRTLAVKAVLFDLDGTLADSASDLAGAINRIRRERGLQPVTVASMRPYASAGARGLLGAGMNVTPDDPEYPALREQFLAYYEAALAETTALFDGIESLLDTLAARGLPFGIVTNKAARYTRPVVAALGLAARAGAIVSGDTTAHPKPHPAPLLHAAELIGMTGKIGVIAPEAYADFVVVDGDPLADLSLLTGQGRHLPIIVKGGEFIKNELN